ncbi:MFS transporter [Paenibacillus sp. V4I7]|uniref:MFS transporter n=1 Tax=Paenibacillus sp. V4I7 TaxID=3042307 RepID=UPI00277D45F6|nr:MFS transporter [Paenibacillus sp. V4I7]MDQ0897442.1 MFS family permease [Paenibacillus sp. V4I7]
MTWTVQLSLFCALLIVPLYLQGMKHYTALETGCILMPQALCAGIGMPISGRLFYKIGAKRLAFIGLAIVSSALFILSSVSVDTSLSLIIVSICTLGLGMSFSMMPLNTHVLNSAPRRLVSRVTPLTTAAQQVIVLFAVAALTGYLTSQITSYATIAGEGANPLAAIVAGYGDTFFLSACIASVGVALSLILRKPRLKEEDQLDSGDEPNPAMIMGY